MDILKHFLIMDRETCLDFQRIQVTEDESLDTYNTRAQLQLDRRLPGGPTNDCSRTWDCSLNAKIKDTEHGSSLCFKDNVWFLESLGLEKQVW